VAGKTYLNNPVIETGSASTVPVLDSNKEITSSSVTPTELGHLSGVTSAVQTQLDAKATPAQITSAVGNHEADTTSVHGIADTSALATKTGSETLTNKTLTAPVIDAVILDGQASTPSNPSAGFYKIYAKDDDKVYKLTPAGVETELGAGGASSGINYASGLFSGESVAGINTYADAAAATPVDGTGGSPSISAAALNTSTPLRGTSSQRLSKGASNEQGEGWSYDFTLDRADYEGSKPVIIQFRYKTSANYANNDVRMFVYDRDGATLLNVLSLTGDGSVAYSSATTLYTGVFYPNSSNNDYRLIFHITSTNASAWDLDIIDLKITPEQTVPGAIVTPWEAWTPTGTMTANTTYTGFKRRNGDYGEYVVSIAFAGAPTSTTLTVNQPNGEVIDTAKMPSATASLTPIDGFGYVIDSGSRNIPVAVVYSSTTAVQPIANAGGAGTGITQASPITFGASDFVRFSWRVPIVGWAASAALSTTEAYLMGAKFAAAKNGVQNITTTSATKVTGWTVSKDNLAKWDSTNNRWTAPRTGRYDINAQVILINAQAEFYYINIYVNGSQVRRKFPASQAAPALDIFASIDLNAGDYVEIFVQSSADTNYDVQVANTWFTITEQQDPTVFSVYGTTALYPASGYSSGGLVNYVTTAGNYGDLDSETLQPGEYDLTAMAVWYSNGATTTTTVEFGISTTSGNSGSGLIVGQNYTLLEKTTTSGSRNPMSLLVSGIVVTTPTTYYLKSAASTSITNLQIGWSWRFRKVR
jgi:hypothetical protein